MGPFYNFYKFNFKVKWCLSSTTGESVEFCHFQQNVVKLVLGILGEIGQLPEVWRLSGNYNCLIAIIWY